MHRHDPVDSCQLTHRCGVQKPAYILFATELEGIISFTIYDVATLCIPRAEQFEAAATEKLHLPREEVKHAALQLSRVPHPRAAYVGHESAAVRRLRLEEPEEEHWDMPTHKVQKVAQEHAQANDSDSSRQMRGAAEPAPVDDCFEEDGGFDAFLTSLCEDDNVPTGCEGDLFAELPDATRRPVFNSWVPEQHDVGSTDSTNTGFGLEF